MLTDWIPMQPSSLIQCNLTATGKISNPRILRWITGLNRQKIIIIICSIFKVKKVNCVMHFVQLLRVQWPGTQCTRQPPSSFWLYQIFTELKTNFTGRLSSKPNLIWLLTTPSLLKYVATIPSNLSLITCFLTSMFHKVVWQHMQGVVGFL